jgi:spore germination protein D
LKGDFPMNWSHIPFNKRHTTFFLQTISLILFVILLSSCAPKEAAGGKPDYKETKQMVLDILQTEEGKKAIEEVMKDKEVKQKIFINEPFVKKTIESTILSPENTESLKKIMSDPKFMKEYAKQLEKEHKHIIKDLMKDPDYRKSMTEILKDPEMEKQFLELTKSQDFRKQTMTVMKESLESPYFRLELLELLSKVAEQSPKSEKKGGGGGEGGGGSGGGS